MNGCWPLTRRPIEKGWRAAKLRIDERKSEGSTSPTRGEGAG
jgi:hypothetical protein